MRTLSHTAERENERGDDIPNNACDNVDDDDCFDSWAAVKAI